MVLKPFTLLCNHHHHVIHWAACILQNWNSSIHWTLVYPSPDSLAASILLPVSINLTMLWTSHKQNYTVFVLLWLDISLSIMVTCVCERWIIKEAEHQRIDDFKLWCWSRLLRVPWTAKRSYQPILKEINPEYSLEVWCWSWSSNTLTTSAKRWLIGKDSDAGKDGKKKEKGAAEDEIFR